MEDARPVWSNGTQDFEADRDTIEDILLCFLDSTACKLFRSVLTYDQAQELGEWESYTVYILLMIEHHRHMYCQCEA